jgi:hypothetical protein
MNAVYHTDCRYRRSSIAPEHITVFMVRSSATNPWSKNRELQI